MWTAKAHTMREQLEDILHKWNCPPPMRGEDPEFFMVKLLRFVILADAVFEKVQKGGNPGILLGAHLERDFSGVQKTEE